MPSNGWRKPRNAPTNIESPDDLIPQSKAKPMTPILRNCLLLAAIGGVAGICFYALEQALARDFVSDRLILALALFLLTLFGGALSMACAVPLQRAAVMAAALGAAIAGLVSWAGLRFDRLDQFDGDPVTVAAVLVLGYLPLPFLMAQHTSHWRNYPDVFRHTWALFLRIGFAWAFVGLVWALIYLSDALFDLVGLTVIDLLLDIEVTPWLITGLVFGLAMAVVDELSDYMSPYLILQVMRLLVPFVLLVLAVFLVALPFRGLTGLFGALSSAAILLSMAAGAVALISASADEADDAAPLPAMMARAARGLALISVAPAALGGWGVWLRVGQYGWTPGRLFAAWAAVVILCFTMAYAVAVVRGAWATRVRRSNVWLALALIASAALWLTPLLSPQGISANSQLARIRADGFVPASVDTYALGLWGRAGQSALQELNALAKDPARAALAVVLATNAADQLPPDPAALRISLAKIMPLQPDTPASTTARDRIFAAADGYQLRDWQDGCDTPLPGGQPGCAMVLADLHTGRAGDEVIIALRPVGPHITVNEVSIVDGNIQLRQLIGIDGQYPRFDQSVALLQAMQGAAPVVRPSPLNMLQLGDTGLTIAQ